jgi:hypothetical protein
MYRNATRTGMVRRSLQARLAIKEWKNRLSGIPAFIIGNGPSLNQCNLKLIEQYFSIGINRCYLKGGLDPTILMWQDLSFWNSEYKKIHNLQALKVSRDIGDPKKLYYNFHIRTSIYKFDSTPHVLHGRGSTGPLAVQFAVALGCSPIILLGMDCKRDEQGLSDYYGENKHWMSATIKNCLIGLNFIRNECPVEVINCSSNTLWPQQTLENVVGQIDNSYKLGRQAFVAKLLNLSLDI